MCCICIHVRITSPQHFVFINVYSKLVHIKIKLKRTALFPLFYPHGRNSVCTGPWHYLSLGNNYGKCLDIKRLYARLSWMLTMLTASTEYLLNLHQRQNLPHPGGMKQLSDILWIHVAKSDVTGLKSQSFQGCNSTNNHTSH